jgi:hypothetical protein
VFDEEEVDKARARIDHALRIGHVPAMVDVNLVRAANGLGPLAFDWDSPEVHAKLRMQSAEVQARTRRNAQAHRVGRALPVLVAIMVAGSAVAVVVVIVLHVLFGAF